MKRLITRAAIALALGLGLTLAVLYVLSVNPRSALADPDDLFVTTDGAGSACTQDTPCTLQTALTQATDSDTVYVAQGTYTGTGAAVVTVTKGITLAGGWDGASTGEVVRDPEAYPSTLDGETARRGVYISGDITPTLDGFIVTRGNASNAAADPGRGGGIYSSDANPIVTNNVITNNIAYVGTTLGNGGGIYLADAAASIRISGNIISSNTANAIGQGRGGGLAIYSSAAIVSGNTFQGNVAGFHPNSQGGGLYLGSSPAIVSGNLIQGNKAAHDSGGYGGGFYTQFGAVTLSGNTVISNTAGSGSGLCFIQNAVFTVTNNVVVQNVGQGVRVWGYSTTPLAGMLVNNTFAQNSDEGVCLSQYATLTLTNNIIVSHTTGISAASGTTATADYTLFFGNTSGDTGGLGSISSTDEITGSDPLFIDPAGWDYHIPPGSPAIDAGTTVPWLTADIDGDVRPWPAGGACDIGADEARWSLVYLPLVLGEVEGLAPRED